MIRDGHEVSAHGYMHENPNQLSDDQEAYWVHRSITALQEVSGEKPAGWRSPLYNFSHRSAELLLKGSKYASLRRTNGKRAVVTHWACRYGPRFQIGPVGSG